MSIELHPRARAGRAGLLVLALPALALLPLLLLLARPQLAQRRRLLVELGVNSIEYQQTFQKSLCDTQ